VVSRSPCFTTPIRHAGNDDGGAWRRATPTAVPVDGPPGAAIVGGPEPGRDDARPRACAPTGARITCDIGITTPVNSPRPRPRGS
jgi:hypothetical protein